MADTARFVFSLSRYRAELGAVASFTPPRLPDLCGIRRHGGTASQPSFGPRGLEATLSEINWAVELRKIEREFDGLPPEPTEAELRHKRDARRREQERQDAREAAGGVYLRLGLAVALGVAIDFWPYQATCGFSLFGYLSAVAAVIVGGLWTSFSTWQHRMVRSHLVAMALILWGLVLGAAQVLPRVGYAKPDATHAAAWGCE
jgi:hypothetical protein